MNSIIRLSLSCQLTSSKTISRLALKSHCNISLLDHLKAEKITVGAVDCSNSHSSKNNENYRITVRDIRKPDHVFQNSCRLIAFCLYYFTVWCLDSRNPLACRAKLNSRLISPRWKSSNHRCRANRFLKPCQYDESCECEVTYN